MRRSIDVECSAEFDYDDDDNSLIIMVMLLNHLLLFLSFPALQVITKLLTQPLNNTSPAGPRDLLI